MSRSPSLYPLQMDTEEESIPSPNINTPLSTPLHTLTKPEELHPLAQNLSPSSPIILSPSKFAPLGLESPSTEPGVSSEEPPQSVDLILATDEQGNSSPLDLPIPQFLKSTLRGT